MAIVHRAKPLIGSELIYLGTERTYDMSSYPSYQDFTEDNFLCFCDSEFNTAVGNQQYSNAVGANTFYYPPKKSYDATTGILTITDGRTYAQLHAGGIVQLTQYKDVTIKTYLITPKNDIFPHKKVDKLLLELFLSNSTASNSSGSSIMINDEYFESTGTIITCKKACKGTAYVRYIRPAITGTGSGNITVNLLQNDVKILSKTYTSIGIETFTFECAVGDVLTMNGNTNYTTYGVGTVYILFIAE